MDTLNPNHPTAAGLSDQWHKLVALLIWKYDLAPVVLTAEDLERFFEEHPNHVVVANDRRDGLYLSLVTREEGERLVREAGGLPA